MSQIRGLQELVRVLCDVNPEFTVRAVAILLAIDAKRGSNRPELMHELKMPPEAMTRMTQALQKQDLVMAVLDPSGSRGALRVYLTSKGQEIRKQLTT
ncbi:MAG: MarR family winged helix-turn-helix transcriptional regulator [Syntrophobacteraceae bacterium]